MLEEGDMDWILEHLAPGLGLGIIFLIGLVCVFKLLQKHISDRIDSLEARATNCEERSAEAHGTIISLTTGVISENTKALQYSADCLHEMKDIIRNGCGKGDCQLKIGENRQKA